MAGGTEVHRKFGDLLFWCAGADPALTDGSGVQRLERTRYVCTGLAVLLTALASGISMTMVVGTVRHAFSWWHLVLAAFWALIIFNLDRSLVSSVAYGKADGESRPEWTGAVGKIAAVLGRCLLAVVIASAVSEPVLLTMFAPEIAHQVDIDRNGQEKKTREQVEATFAQRRAEIEGAWATAQQATVGAQSARDKAQKDVDDEIAGKHGTGVGCSLREGSPCASYQATLRERQEEVRTVQGTEAKAKTKHGDDLVALKKEIDEKVVEQDRITAQANGLLAQEKALDETVDGNSALSLRVWVVRGIFLLVDLLPVIFKFFAPRSVHDRVARRTVLRYFARDETQHQEEEELEGARSRSQRVSDLASIQANEDVLLEQIANEKDLRLHRLKLDHDRDLQVHRWRHEGEVSAAKARFGTTTVLESSRDEESDRLTMVDDPAAETAQFTPQREQPARRVLDGRWVVEGPLPEADRPGFSLVLLAHDLREPSLSVVVKRAVEHDYAHEAIEKDLHFLKKIRSKFVAPMLGVGRDPLFGAYIVTPRYPQTLSRLLRNGDSVRTLEWSTRIVEQVLLGLMDSWTAGCVHLDIKPANIALDLDGNVRLIDFGLAKAVDDGTQPPTGGEIKFTRWYAPLEQVLRQPRNGWASSASDVRAVGAVWYELLTGQRPLYHEARAKGWDPDGIGVHQLVELLRDHDPVDPRVLNPELPEPVAALVMQWLDRDPAKRVTGRLRDRSHAELAQEALEQVRQDVQDRDLQYQLLPPNALAAGRSDEGGEPSSAPTNYGGDGKW
ncbi:DUF4407 domain-containing protein [Amycolatopsis balhimycina]|nr:DUF4407 domain-containing protein [Amycolatopsis balhimycina]